MFGEHIVEGNPVTFDAYLGLETVKSLTLTMNPIQSGTGDPSPTNIRPISGRNSVDVVVTGENYATVELGTYSNDCRKQVDPDNKRARTNALLTLSKNENYTIDCLSKSGKTVQFAYRFWTSDSYGGNTATYDSGWKASGTNFNTNNNQYFTCVFRYSDNSAITDINDIVVYMYVSSTKQTKTITFPTTIYGGTDEVVGGTGASTYGYIASYTGETLPGYWISDRDVYAEGTTPTTGAEICYELATPTTFSTTPTPIPLNKGNNVVSSDADDIELTYSVG